MDKNGLNVRLYYQSYVNLYWVKYSIQYSSCMMSHGESQDPDYKQKKNNRQ